MTTQPPTTIQWLLNTDPAIRWQVRRDLLHEPPETVAAERARVVTEGWGASLLAQQEEDGRWWPNRDPWPLKHTIFTLVQLKELGLDPASPQARQAIERMLTGNTRHPYADKPFFEGETEACINGRILATGAYFGVDTEPLLQQLLSEQLPDGGWNCDAPKSQRASFHSTICVLEGLLAYEQARGTNPAVTAARTRAEEYLLQRHMLRALSTGEVINQAWTQFSYPWGYHYDVLRGLDYLRSAGVVGDGRIAEAIQLVRQKQQADGRWLLENPHADNIEFQMEDGEGQPSRWNTLRALRVLDWYQAA